MNKTFAPWMNNKLWTKHKCVIWLMFEVLKWAYTAFSLYSFKIFSKIWLDCIFVIFIFSVIVISIFCHLLCHQLFFKMGRMKVTSCSTYVILASVILCASWKSSNGYQLTVLHTNDIHARIEQTNKFLEYCKPSDNGKFNLSC